MRLGIDVGGTFTDLVLIDDDTGQIHLTKTLTTPDHLAEGVLEGIKKILAQVGTSMQEVAYLVHGTTIGTNALIERKGARVGLITTAGFRDVLEIARIERPDEALYDMTVDLPEPLVPRYLRLEVVERIAADGTIVTPLDKGSARHAAECLQEAGVEAVAVSLLFSFRNPAHERSVRAIFQQTNPGIPVSLSSEIAPEFREFERTSTTVINAYLSPITERYLDALAGELQARYGPQDLRILQASGGSMSVDVARSHAVKMVNSGPAGGAMAASIFGRLAGIDKVVSVDMGGTSFDIGLIVDGEPRVKPEGEFEGYPVKIPLIDVEGIGAGGGSIAWVDSGGAINVGPKSAGAEPGPACYGHGGERPTVTDANLVLGRLNPAYFLGGEMPLHSDLARQALERHVAEPLNLDVVTAASGVIRVVNANMIRGIVANTTQKGFDVREFSLLAFGGAGPLHAVELAQELGIQQVIIPPLCSVFSAFGAVASDVRHDYVKTIALTQEQATAERLEAVFTELEAQGRRQLADENVPAARTLIERAADLRYEGQSYELTVPMHWHGSLTAADVARVIDDFHKLHLRIYAYGEPMERVEFINLRLTGIGKVPELQLTPGQQNGRQPTPKGEREVYFQGLGFVAANLYERETLHPGDQFSGPCLIEERTSCTVMPPGASGMVDAYQNLIIELGD